MIEGLLSKLKNFVHRFYSPTRGIEVFLSRSVDRADFERREQLLKYKGKL